MLETIKRTSAPTVLMVVLTVSLAGSFIGAAMMAPAGLGPQTAAAAVRDTPQVTQAKNADLEKATNKVGDDSQSIALQLIGVAVVIGGVILAVTRKWGWALGAFGAAALGSLMVSGAAINIITHYANKWLGG